MGRGTSGGEQASSTEGEDCMEHPRCVADGARDLTIGPGGVSSKGRAGQSRAGQGDGTILRASNVCVALRPLPWVGHSIVPLSLCRQRDGGPGGVEGGPQTEGLGGVCQSRILLLSRVSRREGGGSQTLSHHKRNAISSAGVVVGNGL